MISRTSLFIIFLFAMFGTSLAYAQKDLSYSCPVDLQEECSALGELEKDYLALSELEFGDLLSSAHALALGYAHVGNYVKSDKYFNESLTLQNKGASNKRKQHELEQRRFASIVEQYIYNKRYDKMFSALNADDVHYSVCSSALQVLTYHRKFDLVEEIVKQTTCSPRPISEVCSYLKHDEISDLYKNIRKISRSKLSKDDAEYGLNYSIYQCLKDIAYAQNRKGEILTFSNLTGIINTEDPDTRDKIRKTLVSFHLRKGNTEEIIRLVDDAETPKVKAELQKKAFKYFVEQDDRRAFDYYHIVDEPVLMMISRVRTEIAFLFLIKGEFKARGSFFSSFFKAQDPKLKQQKMLRIQHRLHNYLASVLQDKELAEKQVYKYLAKECAGLLYKDCIFRQIEHEYLKSDMTPKMLFEYMKSNALMRKFEFIVQHKDKLSNYHYMMRLLSTSDPNCGSYLAPHIETVIENRNNANYHFSSYQDNLALNCMITNKTAYDIFDRDIKAPLDGLQKKLSAYIRGRAYQIDTAQYLELLNTNFDVVSKRSLILEFMEKLSRQKTLKTDVEAKDVLKKVIKYVHENETENLRFMNSFFNRYNRIDRADRPILPFSALEEDIRKKAQAQNAEKKKLEELKPKTRVQEINAKASEIVTKINAKQNFSPRQPVPVYICTN